MRFPFPAVLAFLLSGSALAQTTRATVLTEDEAVRLALAAQPVLTLYEGRLGVARADVERERRWPNPFLEVTREIDENFFTVTQPFDFSGRRGLRSRAAELRVEAAAQEIESQRIELARDVRLQFFRTASAQALVRTLEAWTRRITDATQMLARLQAGGEVSGYDRRRLERERISAEARLAAERGTLAFSLRRLSAYLGTDTTLVNVTLQPRETPKLSVSDAVLTRIEQRPDIVALQKRQEAAALDRRAAERWRVPLFDVTGGVKRTDDANGTIIGAGVSFPIFNRNQAELLRARAEASIASAQRMLMISRARADVEGLAVQARQLYDAARRFRSEAIPTSERLTATAEAAYQAGEVGILELLDAYRSAVDAEVEAIELEQRAREAEIELGRVIGGITR